jgi:chromosome segregation ATPase
MGKGRSKVISGKKIFRESKEKLEDIEKNTKQIAIAKDTKQLAKKLGEYDAGVSNASEDLQEVEERFKKEISEKEEYLRAAVSDKKVLEARVLKLNEEIQAISGQFQAASKAWEVEKNGFLSQIVAARNECEDMSIQNESVLLQYRAEKVELESGLNESKARCQELLQKMVEDRHLWDSEKRNFESNVAELQTRLDSMATENGLLNHQIGELSTEVVSLKAQLNESNAAAAQLEDERSSLVNEKMFLDKENNSLLIEMDRIKLVSEENQVTLQTKVDELETTLDSVKKDLDTYTETIMEKERNVVDLQYKFSEIAETKKLLEEKNSSLLSDVKQRTVILEEEKAHLRLKIKELESSLHSLNMDLESRDVQLRDLKATRPLFQVNSPTILNGKENGLSGNIIPKVMTENRTSNTTKTVVEKKTPRTTKPVVEKGMPSTTKPANSTKPVVEKRTPSTTKPVVEKRMPSTTKTNTRKQVVENLT